mmetsp:Transcript_24093/g.52200  ORF Transcript_24093/g.52200 Transcript_24093/m.52200 type:complete len:82 (-) Transcript_24093:117-362(-)
MTQPTIVRQEICCHAPRSVHLRGLLIPDTHVPTRLGADTAGDDTGCGLGQVSSVVWYSEEVKKSAMRREEMQEIAHWRLAT